MTTASSRASQNCWATCWSRCTSSTASRRGCPGRPAQARGGDLFPLQAGAEMRPPSRHRAIQGSDKITPVDQPGNCWSHRQRPALVSTPDTSGAGHALRAPAVSLPGQRACCQTTTERSVLPHPHARPVSVPSCVVPVRLMSLSWCAGHCHRWPVVQASSVVAKPQLHSRIMAASRSCSLGFLGIYGSELPLYRRADRRARSGKAEACGQLAPRALELAGRQSADIMLAHRRQASCGLPARPALRRACGVVRPARGIVSGCP